VRKDAYSDTVPKDSVISLNPSDRQIRGHDITVTVSKGPQTVTIPQFERMSTSANDVVAKLTELGLVPHVQEKFGTGPGTYFWDTDPGAGQQVTVGSDVTVYVI